MAPALQTLAPPVAPSCSSAGLRPQAPLSPLPGTPPTPATSTYRAAQAACAMRQWRATSSPPCATPSVCQWRISAGSPWGVPGVYRGRRWEPQAELPGRRAAPRVQGNAAGASYTVKAGGQDTVTLDENRARPEEGAGATSTAGGTPASGAAARPGEGAPLEEPSPAGTPEAFQWGSHWVRRCGGCGPGPLPPPPPHYPRAPHGPLEGRGARRGRTQSDTDIWHWERGC